MNNTTTHSRLFSLALKHWNFELEPRDLKKTSFADIKALARAYLAMTLFLLASIALQYAATSGFINAFSWTFVFGALYLTPFALLVAMAKRLAHPTLFSMAAFLALMGIGGLVRALLGFAGESSVSIGNLIQFIFMSWGLYAHVHFLRKF